MIFSILFPSSQIKLYPEITKSLKFRAVFAICQQNLHVAGINSVRNFLWGCFVTNRYSDTFRKQDTAVCYHIRGGIRNTYPPLYIHYIFDI